MCRVAVHRSDLIAVPIYTNSRFSFDLDKHWRPSSKLNALMRDLKAELASPLPPRDPAAIIAQGQPPAVRKAVVISQWTSMLDLVQRCSKPTASSTRASMARCRCTAASTLSRFADDPNVVVMLLSLRAGGVGINLVSAQTIYLMDPWWNPAVEEQAINRVHRIGQAYPVRVKRFFMQQSVEDRILELQKKKSALVKGALGGAQDRGRQGDARRGPEIPLCK